jgi:hypothetical protein
MKYLVIISLVLSGCVTPRQYCELAVAQQAKKDQEVISKALGNTYVRLWEFICTRPALSVKYPVCTPDQLTECCPSGK